MPKLKLTAAAVERIKPPRKGKRKGEGQVDYFDQALPGFALRITSNGVKSYTCFYRIGGKLRRETLGRHPTLSLAAARAKAGLVFAAVGAGRDPRVEKVNRQLELARADADIYAAAVEDFIAKYAIAKKGNRRHREQRQLLLRANKAWHGRPVALITARDVHDALDGFMAEGKCYTANRVYEALCTFFRWLDKRDRVLVNVMGKIDKPFDGEAPRKRVWSDDELARIWKAADGLDARDAVYLRLVLLLGQRRNEIADMRWEEVDLDTATWKLPAARAKSKRDHTFPLPARAVELLKSLSRIVDNPFVFPGRGTLTGKPRSITIGTPMQRQVQKLSGVNDFTFHDARRTLRTGLDKLRIAPHVKDECLNHARHGVGDVSYSQYDYLDEQRTAFEAWSSYIGSLIGDEPRNVVAFGGKR